MPQSIHINLDAGEVKNSVLREGEELVQLQDDELGFSLLAGGMESGAHSVGIIARLPDGRAALIQISAKSFLNVAAAVRGRLTHLGVIPETINPGIAIVGDSIKREIHFAAETPLTSWTYTAEHAKKFWRTLKEMTSTF
jgi:hypothetical protein